MTTNSAALTSIGQGEKKWGRGYWSNFLCNKFAVDA
eukprot:CAMPEP_0181294718 /NCGR_PEP_ID=MMETSP1101-20121128/3758_1 /TAXON_ID=46948 /ORGANISM="Rhodomonas abbreviata, Strain Caron Lab Isolate" /LENGTH=35 /DNA_ID= /DNA_START= /DNA_END= /DNA_ORIENTATION=